MTVVSFRQQINLNQNFSTLIETGVSSKEVFKTMGHKFENVTILKIFMFCTDVLCFVFMFMKGNKTIYVEIKEYNSVLFFFFYSPYLAQTFPILDFSHALNSHYVLTSTCLSSKV